MFRSLIAKRLSSTTSTSPFIHRIDSGFHFNIETANQPVDSFINNHINNFAPEINDNNSTGKSAVNLALTASKPLSSWTKEQIKEIYNTPLNDLLFHSQIQHRKYHNHTKIQLCTLLSIKTGGCLEDCKYCSQSSSNQTDLKATKLIDIETVFEKAKIAKLNGSTRFCMGSAWRDMNSRKSSLKKISEMVKKINNELGLETCVTLGMISKDQINQLQDSGLTAYNHNIDTSREHYPNIISTRTYDDRLDTIKNIQATDSVKLCTGGILGLGETENDHVSFLHTLSNLENHPESLPINKLVVIKGTRIEKELQKDYKLPYESILKTVATARLIMPKTIIRLAAGRYTMKEPEQLMCFMIGCNAIFTGERMLTTLCSNWEDDIKMLNKWGYEPMKSFEKRKGE